MGVAGSQVVGAGPNHERSSADAALQHLDLHVYRVQYSVA